MVSTHAEGREGPSRGRLHYLGPPGTYSHQVALEMSAEATSSIQSAWELEPCATIKATVEEASKWALDTGASSWALLPYENNSNGPVVDSYDILLTCDAASIAVVGEHHLPVSHSLLCSKDVAHMLEGHGETADLMRLDAVSSHSQALGQCSTFIRTRLRSDVEQVATTSTGEAAKMLSEAGLGTRLEACISSRVCAHADVYDLVVLQDNIQNSGKNVTRFLLLETRAAGQAAQGGGAGTADGSTMRMMLRMETAADSLALTTLMATVASSHDGGDGNDGQTAPRIRSIERRAKKDAVDGSSDKVTASEGHWPFVYLIELEASWRERGDQAGPAKLARRPNEDGGERPGRTPRISLQDTFQRTLARMQAAEEHDSTLACLGLWAV